MKKSAKHLICLAALLGVGLAWPAAAQTQTQTQTRTQVPDQDHPYTPFMLSFVTPFQVPFRDFDVGGLRISAIYGECHDFDGLDLGFVGRTTGHANGLQSCAINIVDGDGVGLQANWIVGFVKGEYNGIQVGGVNYAERMRGAQIGLLYNGAQHVDGIQIGLINTTRTMLGLQIGLINVIQDNDVPFLPIINCYF